jgi:aryl sulfotransferase
MNLPAVTRTYQNHHLDSKRWAGYQPRDSDVIVTTSYKAGTTFTRTILLRLIHGSIEDYGELDEISPWIDCRPVPNPLEEIYSALEKQTDQRFIKSHLPLDGLPYHANVRYLIVARDPRDVFMSFANHYGNYTEFAYQSFNDGERVGDPLPLFEKDIHALWTSWITRGWFEWESEGYPFWGNMHHIQTYWDYKALPNFFFLHYADMLSDLEGSIRRIADFIGQAVTDAEIARVANEVHFGNIKKKAIEMDKKPVVDEPQFFAGGKASFIFKGTNGRWKEALTEDDRALYEATKKRILSADCADWLEQGGQVSS